MFATGFLSLASYVICRNMAIMLFIYGFVSFCKIWWIAFIPPLQNIEFARILKLKKSPLQVSYCVDVLVFGKVWSH